MTGFGAVLAAGLILLALAAAVDLLAGVRQSRWRPVPYLTGTIGSACLLTAGAAALAGERVALGSGGILGTVAIGTGAASSAAPRTPASRRRSAWPQTSCPGCSWSSRSPQQ